MATVRIEPVLAECRVYYSDSPSWDEQHQLALNLRYRPQEPNSVDITMHSAVMPHTRETLRALMNALVDSGVHVIYAHRRDGHRLPGGKLQADKSWRVDLLALQKRLGKSG